MGEPAGKGRTYCINNQEGGGGKSFRVVKHNLGIGNWPLLNLMSYNGREKKKMSKSNRGGRGGGVVFGVLCNYIHW